MGSVVRGRWRSLTALAFCIAGCSRGQTGGAPIRAAAAGPKAYLQMPATDGGSLPQHLSQVGAFSDLWKLTPVEGVRPYEVNVPFWSDGAVKRRWAAVPGGERVEFSAGGEWRFPRGTVFIKHFELPAHDAAPPRRLETRVLVCDAAGGVYGACYRWRDDGHDADLVVEAVEAPVPGAAAGKWYFPGTADCRVCHTPASGGVLGVKTRQLNRVGTNGENQLIDWQRAGLFEADLAPLHPEQLPRLAGAEDSSRTIADRARSYLDVNCANCHRPGGVAGNFDARYDTPLGEQHLIGGPVMIDLGIDHAKTIAPADVWRSIALVRIETSDRTRMPPLAHEAIDRQGAQLVRQWISSMPGRSVVEPPQIEPSGGEYRKSARVQLRCAVPGASIHYTLDGSLPAKASAIYSGPITLTEPTTLRARAYKDGMTASISVQETFIISE